MELTVIDWYSDGSTASANFGIGTVTPILLTYTLTYTLTYLLSFYLYVDGCFLVSLFIDLVQGALLEGGKHILGILRVS